ncbi:hypothetical protein DPMN_073009 [Dreissena polymorpha]|uniref:Uncharacterized protein n=1 Tax=Dreissena polymorpha TaxID=45954 RepID=A0A9D4BY96_DREPO|nr:hypothetical protein DPMN_073009 [Dreissena polymorpha]
MHSAQLTQNGAHLFPEVREELPHAPLGRSCLLDGVNCLLLLLLQFLLQIVQPIEQLVTDVEQNLRLFQKVVF